jgi:hypothetical protein
MSTRKRQPKTRSKKAPAARRQSSAPASNSDFTALVERVATIIEEARARVVRTVNSEMVLSNWLIGREIVEYVQRGAARAVYGEQVLEGLSVRLQARIGRGYSTTNLRYVRLFYLQYKDRMPELHERPDDKPHDSKFITSLVMNAPGANDNQFVTSVVTNSRPSPDPQIPHQDVGQMDSYMRIFDAHERAPGDGPTIGLILCAEENHTIARYSVLNEHKQLFAAKYVTHLPTEEELRRELERDRHIAEAIFDTSRRHNHSS